MTSAVEQFVIELARGTRGRAFVRGLPRDSADDVLAHALLLAWERRAEFDPGEQTLPRWFDRLIREARRALRAPQPHANYAELLADLAGAEDIERSAQLQQASERLVASFGDDAQRVLKLRADGSSIRAIAEELRLNVCTVRAICARARRLGSEWLPAPPVERAVSPRVGSSDDDSGRKAPIDHEIERLLRRPKAERADCPVCWRCMWFYGLRGSGHHTEVDKRKDTIAQSVGDGSIGFTGVGA